MDEQAKREEIKKSIKEIISKRLDMRIDVRGISDDDDLIAKLGLESVQVLELVVALEDTWHIIIKDDELQLGAFSTINKICDFVLKKDQEKAAASASNQK